MGVERHPGAVRDCGPIVPAYTGQRSPINVAIRKRKKLGEPSELRFQHATAVAQFRVDLGLAYSRQDGMRHAVRADGDDRRIERLQFMPFGKVERFTIRVGRNKASGGLPQPRLRAPSVWQLKLFHPFDECLDLGGRLEFGSKLLAQMRSGKVQS